MHYHIWMQFYLLNSGPASGMPVVTSWFLGAHHCLLAFSNQASKWESNRYRDLLRKALLTVGGCHETWHKSLTACLNCMFDKSRPCLIFAARWNKILGLWDALFGQLLPLLHNCLKAMNQMGLVSAKETFGSVWQWKFVVIHAKPYEDKCSSLTY